MKGLTAALALAFALLFSCSSAQAYTVSAPSDSLRVWQSFWAASGFRYQHGSERGDVSFGGQNVKHIVRSNPVALHEVESFARYQAPTFVASLVAGAVLGVALARHNSGVICASAGVLSVSYVFDQIGYRHLKRAVQIHNGERLQAQE